MDSPRIDRKIRLERATTTQDAGSGEEVQTWGLLAEVWASKKDVSDRERIASAEVAAEITTRFVVRWDSSYSDVNAKDRLVCEGVTYQISGTKELGRHEGIEISSARRND